jgi:hypothetical protein
MTSTVGAAVVINDGPEVDGTLTVETPMIEVRSGCATKPDPGWTLIDEAGHYHAFGRDGKLPTLVARNRHIECDGSCGGVCGGEGYDITQHFCAICDELIEPDYVPDSGAHLIPGPRSWTVEVDDLVQGAVVTVRIVANGEVLFGVASVGSFEVTHDGDDRQARTVLYGRGELGRRAR